jgi:hypothetical protein
MFVLLTFVLFLGVPRFARATCFVTDGDYLAVRPPTYQWWSHNCQNIITNWGTTGDIPFTGAASAGAGPEGLDLVIWRPSTGVWWILTSTSGYSAAFTVQWGQSGDVPMLGYFLGSRPCCVDLIIWRPSTGMWWILPYSGTAPGAYNYANAVTYQWGVAGDIPMVPADIDGDGKPDLTVWRPSTGVWYTLKSSCSYTCGVAYGWGTSGDEPLLGPVGDNCQDLIVWRPSSGMWYILPSVVCTNTYSLTQATAVLWGQSGDVPLMGDTTNNDGTQPIIVWRPSTGDWWLLNTVGCSVCPPPLVQWGQSGDIPLIGGWPADMIFH